MNNNFYRLSCAPLITAALMIFSNGCSAQGTASSLQQLNQQKSAMANQAGAVQAADPGLLDPSKAIATAPAKFRVKFGTTKGDFTVEVTRAWAPNGADRFYNMVKVGFFKDVAIFRAIKGFMFQFGIHGTPAIAQRWGDANIKDDAPVKGISNQEGFLSFAQTGRPNSRSSQMFVNLGNNQFLDRQNPPFVPFGQVVEGMDVVRAINTEYGENKGNVQGEFKQQGNAYIKQKYKNIDFIKSVTLVK